jgi:hypothetical protein
MTKPTTPKGKQLLVVQYEQFFESDDLPTLPEEIDRALEIMREQAGARVVGSYSVEDTQEFRDRAVDYIEVTQPMKIRVDR